MPKRTKDDAEIAERRKKVATLYLNKYDQKVIADMLGVSQPTISRDITFLVKTWRKNAEDDILNHKAREIAELELMEKETAANYVNAKSAGEMKEANMWMGSRLSIKDRRAKLLGLDNPAKLDIDLNQPIIVNVVRKSFRKEDNV